MKNWISILFFLVSVTSYGQLDKYGKGDFYHDFVVNKNGDTTLLNPVQFHFPVNDYLDINSDIVNANMLSCYSKTMQCLKEPILYKFKNKNYLRIVLLEEGKSTSYRLEKIDQNNFMFIIKKIDGNYENPGELTTDSLVLNNEDYSKITEPFLKSNIWSIKPHSVQFYAIDEVNIILFESNIYGGYNFTDIYIPFTNKHNLFKEFYEGLKRIKATTKN